MLQQTTVEAVKPYFRAFVERWPDVAASGRGRQRRRHEGLGRARLLFARPQPQEMRRHRCARPWRPRFPTRVEGLRDAARHRRLYGRGHRGDRLRPAGRRGRRQCRARDVAARCDRDAAARRQAGDPRDRRRAGAGDAARRFRAGDDGSRRHDLHADAAALHALPAQRRLRGIAARRSRALSRQGAEGRASRSGVGAAFVAVRGDGAVLLRKRAGQAACSAAWRKCRPPAGRRGATARPAPRPRPSPPTGGVPARIAHVFTHFALDLAVFRADVGEPPGACRALVVAACGNPRRGIADRHEKGNRSCHTRRHQTPTSLKSEASRKPGMTEIRHIVFDIGKVLIHYDPESPVQPADPRCRRAALVLRQCLHARLEHRAGPRPHLGGSRSAADRRASRRMRKTSATSAATGTRWCRMPMTTASR